MYPYILVINKKGEIARALIDEPIPLGWFKVIKIGSGSGKYKYPVYMSNGELNYKFWSIRRWWDKTR